MTTHPKDTQPPTQNERLKAAAAEVDRMLDQGHYVSVDPELAAYMGGGLDYPGSWDDALSHHDEEDDQTEGGADE
jgi:hypothetical protein